MTDKYLRAQLEALLPGIRIDNIVRLYKGFNNDNFLLSSDRGALLMKCYRGGLSQPLLDAQHALAAQGITQAVIAYSTEAHTAIFEFFTQKKPFVNLDEKIVRSLVKLHEYQGFLDHEKLDIVQQVMQLDMCQLMYAKDQCDRAVSVINLLPEDLAFCHNDLVYDNLINADTGAKIIDFEYAQYNDIYFDLAALSCSFDLGEIECAALLQQYYMLRNIHMPDYAGTKLKAYQIAYLLLSINWYQNKGAHTHASPLKNKLMSLLD
ncbi:phosphotransferase [Pseudoalteromonas aurantia]|uniref:Aminoglycoside phosphotransferase domain-containing protein n=1 Tax=Pseudoalteromonas aurantia 208 TaxID=1314867 RepID=A0ABR9EF62_9GAMM|nr:phosphotransferase [Pseudoalteromonas aurantia]MBE0369606.1 hypothetical protein [Pseudoalteromonas aurantia 208]